MTRGLHKDTKVQRGAAGDVPAADRKRGYEAGDAPPAKVAIGVAGFMVLMLVGLFIAGALAVQWDHRHPPEPARAGIVPPPPRLLPDPPQQRRRVETDAMRRLQSGPFPIDRAMEEVVREGWDAAAPPPSPEQTAREHVEAAR